jgi:hypothetical protein
VASWFPRRPRLGVTRVEALHLSLPVARAARGRTLSPTPELLADPKNALDVLSGEELGIDPADLGGSALTAAGSWMLLFSVGAIVPVLPSSSCAARAPR